MTAWSNSRPAPLFRRQSRRRTPLPYAFTRWQPGTPPWPVVVRVIGVVLIAVGGIVVAGAFAQFAAEGAGVPIPGEPNSQRLTVRGPYRYVRNPLYVASAVAIIGQAMLLSRLEPQRAA